MIGLKMQFSTNFWFDEEVDIWTEIYLNTSLLTIKKANDECLM